MRTFGRTWNEDGVSTWHEVSTTQNGMNDYVYATAIVQTLRLNLNESPIYGDWGIPAHPSVVSQIAPDYYTSLTQKRYAPQFANLVITKTNKNPPTYRVNAITKSGVPFHREIPI